MRRHQTACACGCMQLEALEQVERAFVHVVGRELGAGWGEGARRSLGTAVLGGGEA